LLLTQSKSIIKNKSSRQLLLNHIWHKRESKTLAIKQVSLISESEESAQVIISEPKEILLRMFEEQSKKDQQGMQ
jgi:hypothetical protein